jgi:uncharacterized membrane protein (UPF0127 family)
MNFRPVNFRSVNFKPAFAFLCGLIFVTHLSACTSQKLETTVLTITRPASVDAEASKVEITVEIARTSAERSNGLMHRKKLPDGKGMFFIFERDEQHSFWMKNTLIPLSIAFISSDGRIIEIRDMQPHDLNSVRSSRSVRYALETPQGWFNRAGVKPGDVVSGNW